MGHGKVFSLQIIMFVIVFFPFLTNCMKQKEINKLLIEPKRIISCFNFNFTKNKKNYFRQTNKNISLYIFSKSMTEKSLGLILECFYEPVDIQNFVLFLNEISYHAKIEDKLACVHQRLTKIFLDFRFYNFNKHNMYTQQIIEYFYPQNSAFQTTDLKICPIFQFFVLKFSNNHTFTIILLKNGDLCFYSSVPFQKRFKGIAKLLSQNWTKNVFSINLLACGNLSVLNVNLGIKIDIHCCFGEKPIVEFFATGLDNLRKYFRSSPYLGFSQIEFLNQKLSAVSFCWDEKKNLISLNQCECFLNSSLLNLKNIDSILIQKFVQQQYDQIVETEEDDTDEDDSYLEDDQDTKNIKIMIKKKK